jgi:hypothetical protein
LARAAQRTRGTFHAQCTSTARRCKMLEV